MPTLSELQRNFLDAVLGEDGVTNAPLDALITENGIPAARRLQIYKNNTFITLGEALAADYPVVARLVGDDFFAYLARHYIRAFPPPSGTLIDFGTHLGAFLADFEAARDLVYLPDVARLEWAWQKAYHSLDATALSADDLRDIAPDRYGDVVFAVHPSARIVRSHYPVARIWAANQTPPEDDENGEAENEIDLNDGGENVLVVRPEATVHVIALPAADISFIEALGRSAPLARAIESVQRAARDAAAPENFNPTVSLGRLVALGALSHWTIA
ncbi:HvfC/BufC N-terminal domain-containing protein [Varunaivibrio sulfuroxidans]|uniref:Putative DNA-binding protein n=1 Tax=Varunaivibrio sulfuroxidans TaxID=1773489 RepID=A0A4V2UP87_9PROT|nr:DNA-binding domain-containing protein [Varunaivibrio sulfuroxidans]TCS64961.1 putative DNA-binding protein [Varunaivibrio sulfuroxidans]WES29747.1 DNA-binding domain-containing protein [Varunaivibrio sulfuroxidans]